MRLKGIQLKHWHRATRDADGDLVLSSYDLIQILEFLPDDGPFKTAAERGGRLDFKTQVLAAIYNEQLNMRSSYHAAHSTDDNDVRFDPTDYYFVDPVDAKRIAEQEQADAAVSAQTEPDLADAGWM